MVLLIGGAVAATRLGDDATGVYIIAMFVTALLSRFIGWLSSRRDRESTPATVTVGHRVLPAIVFPYRVASVRSVIFAWASFAGMNLAIGLFPGPWRLDESLLTRLMWIGFATILIIAAIGGLRRWETASLFLGITPDGVIEEGVDGRSSLPWTSISRVELLKRYRQPILGVTLSGPIQREGARSALKPIERVSSGRDWSCGLSGLTVPPERVVETIRHFLEHPEARVNIQQQAREHAAAMK